jgi:hypothetical protein
MYLYGNCHTAAEALERFKAGGLQKIGAPNQSGYHG